MLYQSNAQKCDSFNVSFLETFDKYILPVMMKKASMNTWNNNPMQFWQNQLNFAMWCATTGCGVS